MEWIKKINAFVLKNKKKALNYAIILAAGGAILIVVSGFFDAPTTDASKLSQSTATTELSQAMNGLKADLEGILSYIKGVGKVHILISYDSTIEQVPARETTQNYSQQTQNGTQSVDKQYQDRIVMKDTTDGSGPAIVKELMPKPLGVLVVAVGAENPAVKEAIIAGVKAVTGLAEYKIQVIPAK